MKILFNQPACMGAELDYVQDAITNNMHIAGDGLYTKKSQALLEAVLSCPKVLLTTSCTHALEMAALLLNMKPGDEVIVPSFTFVTTVNAFVLRGAKPVFIDVRADTLNMDERQLERLITPKTRAIVLVHYAGVACEMDTIMAIAARYNLPVVEDNAHGLFGQYKGRYLGTFGCLATQSFHETKNFTCGEGGALLINETSLIERAEVLREKGTNRSRFFRGEVDKYTWEDLGSSYVPSDILAAFLYAQLELWQKIQGKRQLIWNNYYNGIKSWAKENNVQLPYVPPECEQAYHLFSLIMPSLEHRQQLIAHLNQHEIKAVFHYLPLHVSKMGQTFGGKIGDCPVTENVSDRLVRLPLFNSMTSEEQQYIIQCVLSFVPENS